MFHLSFALVFDLGLNRPVSQTDGPEIVSASFSERCLLLWMCRGRLLSSLFLGVDKTSKNDFLDSVDSSILTSSWSILPEMPPISIPEKPNEP